MKTISYRAFLILFSVLAVAGLVFENASAQTGPNDRDAASAMLDRTKETLKNNYYDPTFHGVDIDFVFEQARERMKAAPTRDALMMTIASALLTLDDSHTSFFPPSRAADIEYGWIVEAFGDDCFVTRIKPKSFAEAKGLKVGDKLISIDGFKPTRTNLWQLYYRYVAVAPVPRVRMTVVSPGDAAPHTLEIETKITKTPGLIDVEGWYNKYAFRLGLFDTPKLPRYYEYGTDLAVWRFDSFSEDPEKIDKIMDKAKKCKTLVLDLRANGGGAVDNLKRLVGYFFDKEIKVADQKLRKESKPLIAKTRGSDIYKGNLIVLVGHESASASEIFSRIIQMEKRGKIIGDKTAGAVMESRFYDLDYGFEQRIYFGASVTIADLIMPDGKSLEKVGVTPDEIMLPTAKDLAESKDPILSYVARLSGVELAPEKAGTLFPYSWK